MVQTSDYCCSCSFSRLFVIIWCESSLQAWWRSIENDIMHIFNVSNFTCISICIRDYCEIYSNHVLYDICKQFWWATYDEISLKKYIKIPTSRMYCGVKKNLCNLDHILFVHIHKWNKFLQKFWAKMLWLNGISSKLYVFDDSVMFVFSYGHLYGCEKLLDRHPFIGPIWGKKNNRIKKSRSPSLKQKDDQEKHGHDRL